MAARQTMLVTVATSGDLEELERAFGTDELESVVVEIPEHATALDSAREFRRLVDAARLVGIEIEFATDDPLRREMIRILGFPLAAHRILDAPVAIDGPTEKPSACDEETSRIGQSVSTEDDTARVAAYRPWQLRTDEPTTTLPSGHDTLEESEPSFSFVLTPPGAERFSSPHDDFAAGIVRDMSSSGEWRIQDAPPVPVPSPRHLRTSRRLAMLSVVVTIALSAGLFAAILAPHATVTITPAQEMITAELTYGVAQAGQTFDMTIQPQPVTTTLNFSATIQTTGEHFVPDGTARGAVQLTNPLTWEIAVPAGTLLTAESGMTYATAQDVTVPAADPWGSLTFGTTIVDIAATAPGPDSNLDPELLSGQLESGIFYLNRDPVDGGTSRRIATVSQADIDTLRQQVTAELERQASVALSSSLQPGQRVLDGSEQRGPVEIKLNHDAGAEAETLTADGKLTVSAQAYSLDTAHQHARTLIAEKLRQQIGTERTLLHDSVAISEPKEIDGNDGTGFSVHAEADARATISEDDLDALRSDLAGMNRDDALARIRQIPGVSEATIDTAPSWLGDGLPRLASRIDIEIEVDHAGNISAETTASGP